MHITALARAFEKCKKCHAEKQPVQNQTVYFHPSLLIHRTIDSFTSYTRVAALL